ncbi:hypothetical protein [Pseudooceanicola nanhaiensis]|uniref:hypothetical protein n=1 Tax=Pseudooceanicola nanhaiensis TaxID=375761 RepID=UPI004058FFE7
MALMTKDDLAGLQQMLQKARQRPISFGLCMGKKPEDTVICTDLVKSPDVMMRQAKKQGETAKLTQGTLTVEGKIILFSCETDPPKGLKNNLKKFLLKSDITMKPRVLLPGGGEMADEDGEDGNELDGADTGTAEPDAAQDTGPAPEPVQAGDSDSGNDSTNGAPGSDSDMQEDPLAGEWAQALARLGPAVRSFAAGNDPKAATVAKAWAGAEGAAAKGQYKVALAVVTKIEPLLGAQGIRPAPEAPQPDPLAAKWAAVAPALEKLYTAAMARNPENRQKLQAAWAMATEKAGAQDYKAALTIAERLKPALDAVVKAAPAAAAPEVPRDVVPFQKSRVLWAKTRSTMRSELGKLQSAIDAVASQNADLEIDSSGLFEHLEVFDDALEDILDRITTTPDGQEREALKKQAIAAIESYQAALSSGFFSDVDKNNGFAPVAITSTAVNSLSTISRVLSA